MSYIYNSLYILGSLLWSCRWSTARHGTEILIDFFLWKRGRELLGFLCLVSTSGHGPFLGLLLLLWRFGFRRVFCLRISWSIFSRPLIAWSGSCHFCFFFYCFLIFFQLFLLFLPPSFSTGSSTSSFSLRFRSWESYYALYSFYCSRSDLDSNFRSLGEDWYLCLFGFSSLSSSGESFDSEFLLLLFPFLLFIPLLLHRRLFLPSLLILFLRLPPFFNRVFFVFLLGLGLPLRVSSSFSCSSTPSPSDSYQRSCRH